MSKCNGVILFPKSTPLPTSYGRINWVGGICPCQFLLPILPSRPLHLYILLPLPLTHNLICRNSLLSIPLPLPCHLCHPRAHLSLPLPIPLPIPYHICPPRAPLSIPVALPHNLCPPRALLSLSLPLNIPHPPCLSQRLPRCHSYPNMSQIIKCI